MVRSLFPNLFESGVASVNFSDVVVVRSAVNDNCVIVKARKPVEFLLNIAAQKDLECSWVDSVVWRGNSDGSLSVWDK